jgi:hypothetical protein
LTPVEIKDPERITIPTMKYELSKENIKKAIRHPVRALDEVALDYLYRLPSTLINSRYTIGTNIFDEDWDVLIILDTCRFDALRELEDEYDFISSVDSALSVGGSTFEWTARTFDEMHINDINTTGFINGQNSVYQILGRRQQYKEDPHLMFRILRYFPTLGVDDFDRHENVFRYKRWGGEGPANLTEKTPPRYVTERAIQVSRQNNHERLIIYNHILRGLQTPLTTTEN